MLLEMGERLGITDAMNARTNDLYGLRSPQALNPGERFSWEEITDRICQAWFGPEHGLAWFRQDGVLTWPKRLEEAYPAAFGQGVVPLHPKRLAELGEEMQRSSQIGFDLQAVSYEVPWHTASHTRENPWLNEVSQSEPYSHFICLNPRTAAARNIVDGDAIWVESATGRRVQGRARLTEGVHPEVVAIADGGGHWARGMPVAREQGAFFNALFSSDPEETHTASPTVDPRVRVYKE
jgi:anaerobic selenocysteine-containing dehydrogenase